MSALLGILASLLGMILWAVVFVTVQGLVFGYIRVPDFFWNPVGAVRKRLRHRAWNRVSRS